MYGCCFFTSLLLKRIACLALTDYPAESIGEEQILCGIAKLLIAMPHIQVDHAVAGIGPYHREIAEADHIFDAYRIVLG